MTVLDCTKQELPTVLSKGGWEGECAGGYAHVRVAIRCGRIRRLTYRHAAVRRAGPATGSIAGTM